MGYDSYQSYKSSVQEDAENIVKEQHENDGSLPSTENGRYYDRTHERADSEVTYYSTCDDILRFSNNDNAAFDHIGSDVLDGKKSRQEVNTVLAYFAYCQDLCEALSNIDDEEAMDLCGYDHECPSEHCSERYKEENEAEYCCNLVERVANADL